MHVGHILDVECIALSAIDVDTLQLHMTFGTPNIRFRIPEVVSLHKPIPLPTTASFPHPDDATLTTYVHPQRAAYRRWRRLSSASCAMPGK